VCGRERGDHNRGIAVGASNRGFDARNRQHEGDNIEEREGLNFHPPLAREERAQTVRGRE